MVFEVPVIRTCRREAREAVNSTLASALTSSHSDLKCERSQCLHPKYGFGCSSCKHHASDGTQYTPSGLSHPRQALDKPERFLLSSDGTPRGQRQGRDIDVFQVFSRLTESAAPIHTRASLTAACKQQCLASVQALYSRLYASSRCWSSRREFFLSKTDLHSDTMPVSHHSS